MAKPIVPNQLFHGQSGKIGNYVLKFIDGQTHVTLAPKKRTHNSPLQQQQISRFQLATQWANAHKNDPEFILAAQQNKRNGINAYNLAIKHALNNPSILAEFTPSYTQPNFTQTSTITLTKSVPTPRARHTSLKATLLTLIILITTTLTSYANTYKPTPNYFKMATCCRATQINSLSLRQLFKTQSINETYCLVFPTPPLVSPHHPRAAHPHTTFRQLAISQSRCRRLPPT